MMLPSAQGHNECAFAMPVGGSHDAGKHSKLDGESWPALQFK
jgi:hypothetical protein